jgi:hypothetical protein
MWITTDLEQKMYDAINMCTYLNNPAETYIDHYNSFRTFLCDHVYPHMISTEASISGNILTDHSEKHIRNVLNNINKILENYSSDTSFNPLELYFMCLSALVHDIGNIFGRVEHEKATNEIFSSEYFKVFDSMLRRMVNQIAKAHGGEGDTLSKLSNTNHIEGEQIRAQKIASILRFADELAEGPQRAFDLLLVKGLIGKDSAKYHQYALNLKHPKIEKNAIIMDFEFIIKDQTDASMYEILSLTLNRILKMNRERVYCGHYNKYIEGIKKVNVTFNFYIDEDSIEPLNINENITKFEITNLDSIDCIGAPLDVHRMATSLLSELEPYKEKAQ